MEKPTKKQKKVLLILGVTGAVYASFKYLLPLVIPFLIAYMIALALRPLAEWIEKRTRIPIAAVTGILLILLLILLGSGVYFGGRRLCIEARTLFENLPSIVSELDYRLTRACFFLERLFHLSQGCLVKLLRGMLLDLLRVIKETTMPFLFVNSMAVFKVLIQVTILSVIIFVATILSMQEMEHIRKRRERSIFRKEFALLSKRLVVVGNAYLKTQLSIISLTTIICILGFSLIGNPYNILLGIGVGLLDALPIFGTGTVLIPWALILLFSGNWVKAAVLFGLYIVCYFIREILEAKIMGNRVGLSALETLISMYVGLQLFGLIGFLLGPIGLLIIEDMVEAYNLSGMKEIDEE